MRRTHDLERAIIAVLERLEQASPWQIAAAMGGEWLEPAKAALVRQMLQRMVRRHRLLNPAHGFYGLAPNYTLGSLDNFDCLERAIDRFLTAKGGSARTGDIHRALGDRPQRERGYDFQLIQRVLKESPKFDNYGRGWWRNATERATALTLQIDVC
jgi:hypothetical protein